MTLLSDALLSLRNPPSSFPALPLRPAAESRIAATEHRAAAMNHPETALLVLAHQLATGYLSPGQQRAASETLYEVERHMLALRMHRDALVEAAEQRDGEAVVVRFPAGSALRMMDTWGGRA